MTRVAFGRFCVSAHKDSSGNFSATGIQSGETYAPEFPWGFMWTILLGFDDVTPGSLKLRVRVKTSNGASLELPEFSVTMREPGPFELAISDIRIQVGAEGELELWTQVGEQPEARACTLKIKLREMPEGPFRRLSKMSNAATRSFAIDLSKESNQVADPSANQHGRSSLASEMLAPLVEPVLFSRSEYLSMLSAAERAAEDPTELPSLLEAIRKLERERSLCEWDASDQATLEALGTPITNIQVVGDQDGFYRFSPGAGDESSEPLRTIWENGSGRKIVVVDRPPVPFEAVRKFYNIGAAVRNDYVVPEDCPLLAFSVQDLQHRNHIRGPAWTNSLSAGPEPQGSWVLSGTGEPIAWAPFALDAQFIARCVNAMMRLERDVARYGGVLWDFPARIAEEGILGLVQRLRRSIAPQERWEAPAPQSVQDLGAQMERDLRAFLEEAKAHRFNVGG